MKKLLIFSLLAISTCFAAAEPVEPCKDFSYVSIGGYLPLPFPTFGIGSRSFYVNGDAFDASLNLVTILVASAAELQLKYIHYFNKKWYMGGGSAAGFTLSHDHEFCKDSFFIGPVACVGMDFSSCFTELNCRWPTTSDHNGTTYYPAIAMKCGFKF